MAESGRSIILKFSTNVERNSKIAFRKKCLLCLSEEKITVTLKLCAHQINIK